MNVSIVYGMVLTGDIVECLCNGFDSGCLECIRNGFDRGNCVVFTEW